MKSTSTILGLSAVVIALYFLSKGKRDNAMTSSKEEPTDKKKLPSMGGGGGGFGGIPVAPTLAVPTSQIIVQTQPTPTPTPSSSSTQVTNQGTSNAVVGRNDGLSSSSGGTSTGGTSTSGTSTGGSTQVGGGGGATGAPIPTPTPTPTTPSTVRFMDFFNIDADGQDVIESIL
jgi:hypothetical protein